MTTTVLAHRYGLYQQQINHLQSQIDRQTYRLSTIQPLLQQASEALTTLQDASGELPGELIAQVKSMVMARLLISASSDSQKPHEKQSLSPEEAIVDHFQQNSTITHRQLQTIMTDCCGGSDAEGKWCWKDADEAIERAVVRYIRRNSFVSLDDVLKLETLYPTHARRTEDSVELQQFSTPPSLSYIMAAASGLTADDIVLEPSAGNGFLAVWAEKIGAKLLLNEICSKRSNTLEQLFDKALSLTQYDGENIHDYLPPQHQPTVVLINPPFTTSPNISKRNPEATFNHLYSAWQRLAPGGRLVAITADWFAPDHPKWKQAFAKFEKTGQVVFSTAIAGKLYRKQGTTIATRLTVIDKGGWPRPNFINAHVCDCPHALLNLVESHVPKRVSNLNRKPICLATESLRQQDTSTDAVIKQEENRLATVRKKGQLKAQQNNTGVLPLKTTKETADGDWKNVQPVTYSPEEVSSSLCDTLYQAYQTQSITIDQAQPHPTTLVQSAAMATVKPPVPTYQPQLPADLITKGILSAPQLESIIYAGEAHRHKLSRHFLVKDNLEQVGVKLSQFVTKQTRLQNVAVKLSRSVTTSTRLQNGT